MVCRVRVRPGLSDCLTFSTSEGPSYHKKYNNGSIYYTPADGARAVYGEINIKLSNLSLDKVPLVSFSYPITDEQFTIDKGLPGHGRAAVRGSRRALQRLHGRHNLLVAIQQWRARASGPTAGPSRHDYQLRPRPDWHGPQRDDELHAVGQWPCAVH